MFDPENPGRHWDERYGEEPTVYGVKPNAFFARQLVRLPLGRILLPGDGEGRNAVHAAQLGWSVRSFDASPVGVAKSLAMAEEKGVSIEAEVARCEDWSPGEVFDVIGLFYLHLPAGLRADFHARTVQWLKPGGIVVLEGFAPGQLRFGSGGPKALDMLFSADVLERDFSGLEVTYAATLEVELDEGPYHQGTAEVTRIVARRPG